jgi:methyl-accepting chemotaxis protein
VTSDPDATTADSRGPTTGGGPATDNDARRPRSIRGAFRRLSTGLLIYGAIGIVVAIVGLVALLWIGARIEAAADRADTTIAQLTATIDRTSTAIEDAGATAGSFATTLDDASLAVAQAATIIRDVQPQLESLETQFRSISILGNQPLSRAADLVGNIKTQLDGFDERLDGIATSLGQNRDSLVKNADSLDALGASMGRLSDRLKSGVIQESLSDLQTVVEVLILVFVVWTAVPAVGAIILGWWLRSELRRPEDEGSTQLVA